MPTGRSFKKGVPCWKPWEAGWRKWLERKKVAANKEITESKEKADANT